MTDRGPSSSETRARMGFALSLAVGVVAGVAVSAGSGSWLLGVSIGVVIGLCIAVAINWPRPGRGRPGAEDDPDVLPRDVPPADGDAR